MATMTAANRARSAAMREYWARKRDANERRSESLRSYWLYDLTADDHRRKLSRAMKRYWRNRQND